MNWINRLETTFQYVYNRRCVHTVLQILTGSHIRCHQLHGKWKCDVRWYLCGSQFPVFNARQLACCPNKPRPPTPPYTTGKVSQLMQIQQMYTAFKLKSRPDSFTTKVDTMLFSTTFRPIDSLVCAYRQFMNQYWVECTATYPYVCTTVKRYTS